MRIRRLTRSTFVRSAFVLTSGTTIAQAIPFILTPILTRIYTPDDLGVLALYTSIVVVFLGALSLGFSYAIVSAEQHDVLPLTALSIRCIAALTIPSSALILLMVRLDLLGFGALSPYVVLSIVISLIFTELFLVLRYVVLREGHYRDLSSVAVTQSLARAGSQVVLGVAGIGWWGLTFGDTIGRAFGIRSLFSRTHYSFRELIFGWPMQTLRPVFSKYRDYAKYSAPGSIFDSLSAQIVAPLLAAQFGLAVAGQYGIVLRLVVLPVALIGGSVADVFHHRLADSVRSGEQSPERLFLLVAGGLAAIGSILAGSIVIIPTGLWGDILGEDWKAAGQYAAAIAPRAAIMMVVSPISRTVLVFGGQKIKLGYNLCSLAIIFIAMELAKRNGWGAVDTIATISWVQAGTGSIYFLLLWGVTRRGAAKVN